MSGERRVSVRGPAVGVSKVRKGNVTNRLRQMEGDIALEKERDTAFVTPQ